MILTFDPNRDGADGADREFQKSLFHMDGRAVKEYALSTVPKMIEECSDMAGVSLDDVDRVIFHQGNVRLVLRGKWTSLPSAYVGIALKSGKALSHW